MRIAIVADACDPPTNGVSRMLRMLTGCIERKGHQVRTLAPPEFRTLPCPTQPDIRLAVAPGGQIARMLDDFAPDAIHIATEGPLGLAARRLCTRRGWPFTTMFTGKFAETIEARLHVPATWIWPLLRWFHSASSAVLVSTESLQAELSLRGFDRLRICARGVDTAHFRPRPGTQLPYPRPIWLYVGRVAPEKSIHEFLRLDLPGTKVVVGAGPDLGEELAQHYAGSDVFVFPSRTDTFGLVLLEALASGVPVAAYPVPGPLDILGESGAGRLSFDLRQAAQAALEIPRERCRAHAHRYSWERCADQFVNLLHPVSGQPADADATLDAPANQRREGRRLEPGRYASTRRSKEDD